MWWLRERWPRPALPARHQFLRLDLKWYWRGFLYPPSPLPRLGLVEKRRPMRRTMVRRDFRHRFLFPQLHLLRRQPRAQLDPFLLLPKMEPHLELQW